MPLFQDNAPLKIRFRILKIIFAGVIALLLGKTWQLSILEFELHEELARSNRVRKARLVAPRGMVRDRNGLILSDSTPHPKLVVYRDNVKDLDETFRFIAQGLDEALDRVQSSYSDSLSRVGRHRPVEVATRLTFEEISFFKARQAEHPEVRIELQPSRLYPFGKSASHLLGYVGEITERELGLAEFQDNKPGDIVGKFGAELSYNRLLSGEDGFVLLRVDSRGRMIAELDRRDPVPGGNLDLTIDLGLQQTAEEELGDDPGAAVVLDPRNGEILAMASSPSFDPNLFALGITSDEWKELTSNTDRPLRNRTIQSSWNPGSTFKPFLALAGLEQKLRRPDQRTLCRGAATLYGHRFRCNGVHGDVDLREAIRRSCNVYFYQLGDQLGVDLIHRFGTRLGLGQATGLELAGEVDGIIPSRRWKRRVKGERWYPGDTVSVAIGQGLVEATPVQMAQAIGRLATGQAPPLRLRLGDTVASELLGPTAKLAVDPENARLVREAMWASVNQSGTGRSARVEGFDVCGKTGTAQVISKAVYDQLPEEKRERFADNSWFVGFAPRDNPEIALAIIVQRGGGGSARAAPIAGKIFRHYYESRKVELPGDASRITLKSGSRRQATQAAPSGAP